MLNRKFVLLITLLFGLLASATYAQVSPFIDDGRLNNYDAAAPIVIYPVNGGLDVYIVDPATGGGILTLSVPASTLAVEGVYLLARNEAGTVNVFKEGDEFVIMGIAPNLETYVFRVTDPTTNQGFRSYTLHYPIYTTAEELGVPVEEVDSTVEQSPEAPEPAMPEVEEEPTEAPTVEPTPEPAAPEPAPPSDRGRAL